MAIHPIPYKQTKPTRQPRSGTAWNGLSRRGVVYSTSMTWLGLAWQGKARN